jgi:hypothetical protein
MRGPHLPGRRSEDDDIQALPDRGADQCAGLVEVTAVRYAEERHRRLLTPGGPDLHGHPILPSAHHQLQIWAAPGQTAGGRAAIEALVAAELAEQH